MRELGSLRDDARGFDPAHTAQAVVAEVDALIAAAAQAVDETIPGPESEGLLIGACEAIMEARERIQALKTTAARAADIVGRSVELRRESARLLYRRISTDGDRA